jgi:hypothetical protein
MRPSIHLAVSIMTLGVCLESSCQPIAEESRSWGEFHFNHMVIDSCPRQNRSVNRPPRASARHSCCEAGCQNSNHTEKQVALVPFCTLPFRIWQRCC